MLTPTQIGILKDVAANKVDLAEVGEWLRDQLCELVLHDPQLIDVLGPSVFLTEAGQMTLSSAYREGEQ